ncbi:MAG: TrmH family RNA methyltransferase [Candidatus Thorarchaeota archaeon]
MFGIGIENHKYRDNIGTLARSAVNLGANILFTIGNKYKRTKADTIKAEKHLDILNFDNIYEFLLFCFENDFSTVGIEISSDAEDIRKFQHPVKSMYILGHENSGLSKLMIDNCRYKVQIPSNYCMNVSVAGAVVMYDRLIKG